MKKSGPPTLEDVAASAGVSTATISRCINDPDKVAKPTRKRIEHAIQKLGYTPNFGGRMLASNKTHIVGAVIPSMANAMFSNGIQAFQERLSENGITLLIASSGYNPDQEYQQVQSLLASGVGGLLLIGAERPQKTVKLIKQRNIPYDDKKRYYAGFDNHAAMYKLAKLVIDYGHKNIAIISGNSITNDRAENRIKGIKDAIAEHSDSVQLVDLIETEYRLETGGNAFDQVMSKPIKPSVIMCGNDVLAAGAIVRARQRGIRVPEDVSITGFDDLNIASVVNPALTTVRVPHFEMGTSAATLLLDLLSKDPNAKSIELKTELIVRESLARRTAP